MKGPTENHAGGLGAEASDSAEPKTGEPTEGENGGLAVYGFQTDIAWEDPEENFRRVRALAAGLEEEGPRLFVLPEMFATGFSMDACRVASYAEGVRAFLGNFAREHRAYVLAGYGEPAEPRPANACSLVNPRGEEILHFWKLHPFSLAREHEHYRPGDRVATASVEGVRITPFICYDLRFPEPFRAVALGTDLFCVLANWPARRREAWQTLLRARAVENQAYVLGVNRVGEGGGEPHTGDTALYGPLGEVLAVARPGRPEVVKGRVDAAEVGRIRRRFGFLRDRRPRLYRRLEASSEGEEGGAG